MDDTTRVYLHACTPHTHRHTHTSLFFVFLDSHGFKPSVDCRRLGKWQNITWGILGFSASFPEQVAHVGDSQPVHLIHSDQPAGETAVHTRTEWVPCRSLAV